MDSSMIPHQSVEDVKKYFEYREKNLRAFEDFQVSREVMVGSRFLRIDEDKQLWYFDEKKAKNPVLFKFSDILEYELTEDGDSVTKGGLGRAIVGGALLGGVGAVVGGVTGRKKTKQIIRSLKIRVSTSNTYAPSLNIEFIAPDTECKTNSYAYRMYKEAADKVVSLFDYMCNQAKVSAADNTTETASAQPSGADEILKYKDLLDAGIISQEEFEAKKRQILDI